MIINNGIFHLSFKQIIYGLLYPIFIILHYRYVSLLLKQESIPYHEPVIYGLIISIVLNILIIILLPYKIYKISNAAVWLIYIMIYLPTLYLPHYILNIETNLIISYNLIITLGFLIIIIAQYLPSISISNLSTSHKWFTYSVGLVIISILLFYIYKNIGNFSVINIFHVYEQRDNYKELLQANGRIFAYISIWLYFLFVPITLSISCYFINTKQYFIAVTFIIISIVSAMSVFFLTGYKSAFFSIMLVTAIILSFKTGVKGYAIIKYIIYIYLLSYILIIINFSWPALHFIRRLFLAPGINASYYYDYFHIHQIYYLSHSFLSKWFLNEYGVGPPFIIGKVYYNAPNMSANANFWADAFANFSYTGIIIYSILLSMIIWIADSISKKHSLRFALAAIGMSFYSLANSSLFTTILTYGLIFSIIFLWLFPPTKSVCDTVDTRPRKTPEKQ